MARTALFLALLLAGCAGREPLPEPLPPVLHPGTKQPIGPEDLAPIFPMAVIQQEVSTERQIEIPDPVREVYRQWRPAPLFRARRLEKMLDTPARIYYKNEGVSPAGSHKPNTAVAQAWYNKQFGIKRLTTETGAGQWGSSLAMACSCSGVASQSMAPNCAAASNSLAVLAWITSR